MVTRLAHSRPVLAAGAFAMGLALAGGIAWAAIPNSTTGQITACYPTSGTAKGQLRVIDAQAGATCKAGEVALSWQKNGVRWRGAWAATATYSVNDVVTYGRARQVFVATVANTGKRPSDTGTQWKVWGGGTGMTPSQVGMNAWWQDPARPATVAVGNGPEGVAFDGASIWVANFASNAVSKINPATNTIIATVPVGVDPAGVAFDGSFIWVSNNGAGTVSKINPSTNAVVATVDVGDEPQQLVFDGTSIWVANALSDDVSKINPATNTVTATIGLFGAPWGVAFDGTDVWVGNANADIVSKIDPNTNAVIANVSVNDLPLGMVFDGQDVWVARART